MELRKQGFTEEEAKRMAEERAVRFAYEQGRDVIGDKEWGDALAYQKDQDAYQKDLKMAMFYYQQNKGVWPAWFRQKYPEYTS